MSEIGIPSPASLVRNGRGWDRGCGSQTPVYPDATEVPLGVGNGDPQSSPWGTYTSDKKGWLSPGLGWNQGWASGPGCGLQTSSFEFLVVTDPVNDRARMA